MSTLLRKILSLAISLLTALGITFPGKTFRDIRIIEKNISSGLISGELSPYISSDIQDRELLISLTAEDADGDLYFTDLDYSVNRSSSWRPRFHVQRMFYLAECRAASEDEKEKKLLGDTLSSLMNFWIKNDYQSVNWWYNEIAMPNLMGQIAILANDVFTEEQKAEIIELTGRGCLTVNPDTTDLTGTNASDAAVCSIYYGILTDNALPVIRAVSAFSQQLEYSSYEGLRRDHSFFQHGNRLYIGGYGLSFVGNCAEMLLMLEGSDFTFTEKQLRPLSLFITEGIRYMSYGNALDPSVTGRTFSRSSEAGLEDLEPYLRQLCRIGNMPDKEKISAFADSIAYNTGGGPGLKYFDDAEFLVINNPGFYFSFRGGNKDMYYAESLNGENFLSYNSSFPGVTTVMGTGDEYRGFAPVMDYSSVPGTTAVYETDEQLAAHADFTNRILTGRFLSASEDGRAISSAKTSHEGIDMTIACFASENAAVLLGAGMKNDSGRPMTTTLNQCIYSGEYEQSGNTVIHSGVKYVVLEGGEPGVTVGERTGSYRRNNLSESDDPVTAEVFTVSLPCSGSYAYAVMSEDTQARIEIIINTEDIQAAVMPDGRIAAVFHSPGSFEYGGKTYMSAVPAAKFFTAP